MVDKISITIIAFVAVFAISAGLLATNSIPAIFNTGSIANDTKYETINQTKILADFIALYLANIANDTEQTKKEIVAAKATLESQQETLRAQEESLKNQEETLRNQELAVIKQVEILNENKNITADILKISEEHKEAAAIHDQLQKKGDILLKSNANLTQLTYELLQKHTANTTAEAEEKRW